MARMFTRNGFGKPNQARLAGRVNRFPGRTNTRGIGNMGMQALSMYYDTDESKEGVRAFTEKRKPDFRKYQK